MTNMKEGNLGQGLQSRGVREHTFQICPEGFNSFLDLRPSTHLEGEFLLETFQWSAEGTRQQQKTISLP